MANLSQEAWLLRLCCAALMVYHVICVTDDTIYFAPSVAKRYHKRRHSEIGLTNKNLTVLPLIINHGHTLVRPQDNSRSEDHVKSHPDALDEVLKTVEEAPGVSGMVSMKSSDMPPGSPTSRSVGATNTNMAARLNVDLHSQAKQIPGTRIKLPRPNTNDDEIIFFPNQPDLTSSTFVPTILDGSNPTCANGQTFCDSVESYPVGYLENKLKEKAVVFRQFFGEDVVSIKSHLRGMHTWSNPHQKKAFKRPTSKRTETNITQRIDPEEDLALCTSTEKIVFPKLAQNKEEKWLFIINQDQYQQGVRIEVCARPDAPCSSKASFPQGYRSFCKQKYIYRKLLSLNDKGDPVPDSFKLPACCSCHVRSGNHDGSARKRKRRKRNQYVPSL